MEAEIINWPVCGKCREVAWFPWIGGAHHCAVAEPEEELDESPPRVDQGPPVEGRWPDCVRDHAGHYVSTDERGLHYLLWRVIDNAIDEAVAGYATKIDVILHGDGSVSVVDNGRGLPLSGNRPFVPSPAEVTAAMLPTDDDEDDDDDVTDSDYRSFGGSRAPGVWIVNALSARMQVVVVRDNHYYVQEFERAVPYLNTSDDLVTPSLTCVRFWADRTVFETTEYDFDRVARRLHHLAFLNRGLTIEVVDERAYGQPRSRVFCFTDGLVGLVTRLNRTRSPIHDDVIHFWGRSSACKVQVAMQWSGGYSENVQTFVNNIDTSDWRGSHYDGFREALTNVISRYARDRKLMRDTEPDLPADAIREGLSAVVVVHRAEPAFANASVPYLVDREVERAAQGLCEHHLTRWFETNPIAAEAITTKAIRAADNVRMPKRSHCRG